MQRRQTRQETKLRDWSNHIWPSAALLSLSLYQIPPKDSLELYGVDLQSSSSHAFLYLYIVCRMAPESTPAKTGKLSLYADLLDPSDNSSQPGTISRAPVVFKQASGSESQQDDTAAAKKQQISAGSLYTLLPRKNLIYS